MTKEQCLEILKNCQKIKDPVEAHMTADGALLTYINDGEIVMAFNLIDKNYNE